MKTKTILLALTFVAGLVLFSCSGSNKVCPAYSQETVDNNGQDNS